MISMYSSMLGAISQQNIAQQQMMQCSNAMMSSIGCQPLSPSFGQFENQMELQMKANETKVSVMQNLREALEKALGKKIKDSTPKYGGLDCKA